MIQHIFKLIWSERKLNVWILAELIIVFCVMWFCCEYLFITTKHYFEPKGFDLENTYLIDFGVKKDQSEETEENAGRTIYERIKKHPLIESICISNYGHPYSGSSNGVATLIINNTDTLMKTGYAFERTVSPGYFDVFRIKVEQGRMFDINGNRETLMSPDGNNTFFGKPANEIRTFRKTFFETDWGKGFKDGDEMNVVGVVNKIKFVEYEPYGGIIFYPANENDVYPVGNICVRIRSGVKDFPEQFEKEMQEQLTVGPFFLSKVIPFSDIKARYLKKFSSYDSNFKSVLSITSFLLINIFLGVIGTFWFRTQSRKRDIGLRIALGSSKKDVKGLFIKETFVILFIASIFSTIVCINISLADILKFIGMPSIDKDKFGIGSEQYIINYLITFIILGIISFFAVWYPAKKASDIQPVEALRDE